MSSALEMRQYPIGKFEAQETYTKDEIEACIRRIEELPAKLEAIINALSEKQLDTSYREDGWTARQLIHHISDSHLHAYIRIKWTITEDTPTIKAYHQDSWANTPEVKLDPVSSLALLKALHQKMGLLMRMLSEDDLRKEFYHPEMNKHVRLDRMIALYAWHGEHHRAHLKLIEDE